METKNQDEFVTQICESFGYCNHFTIPPQGLSGGLALFWRQEVELEVMASSPNYIDTLIKSNGKSSSFITFIYGAPQQENRGEVWDRLSLIGYDRNLAWLLTGNFNDILENSEKVGGPPRSEGSFITFRTFDSVNGLWDGKHSGNALSWRGTRHSHFVKSRLDRSLANCTWNESFPSGICVYLNFEG